MFLNSPSYFPSKFIFNITIKFILLGNLISLYKEKRFYDFPSFNKNSFNLSFSEELPRIAIYFFTSSRVDMFDLSIFQYTNLYLVMPIEK